MWKCLDLALAFLLVVSLTAMTSYAGYAKTAHALANAGSQAIVICGSSGETETITLDRNGELIDNSGSHGCLHCADCTLVAAGFATPSATMTVSLDPERVVFADRAVALLRAHDISSPSRGPPGQKDV